MLELYCEVNISLEIHSNNINIYTSSVVADQTPDSNFSFKNIKLALHFLL